MSLMVLDAGLHSLLVDLGRPSARSLGVPLGGAADRFAFQLGNLLVGNDPDAVALELTLKGPTLRAEIEALAVVFGAPFEVRVNGREVSPNTTFRLAPGDELRIGGTPSGCRAYLCVASGFESLAVLGSRSGLEPLKRNQDLTLRAPAPLREWRGGVQEDHGWVCSHPNLQRPMRSDGNHHSLNTPSPLTERGPEGEVFTILRALPGAQADWFPPDVFFNRTFTVSPASNRMGVRLLGEPIPKRASELASEPVAPGAVQVTNDGLPIALGVDGQTIGGYPKVAHVIRADLDLLGQLRPGDAVRFACVNEGEAEAAARERARELRLWRMRLELRK